ncbi:hypothetical protein [Aurantibacillus circumpalustris]|uniref:hypothetical protein n=1 Tax=Aurantibacillus circumpalustris TaxID=3036359 RepID=UPI00295B7D08|nr:hypothetical protein [Aurantibacillus circumpalustris]
MISAILLSLISILKSGKVLAFVNSLTILFLIVSLFFLSNADKTNLSSSHEENAVLLDSSFHQDITFIQPFTSLAGFNWRFGKDMKRKEKEVKVISVPTINLPNLFKR